SRRGVMDWNTLRRIVTGDGENGRSSVVIDGGAANLVSAGEAGLAEIWQALLDPARLQDGVDVLKTEDVKLEPAAGAVKVRWFTVAPEDISAPRAAVDAAAAAAFALVGAAHARVDTARHPMMHKTATLDVIILVRGAVDLLLDDGEARALKPGDVVIQRGTNHAWVNRGRETAVLVAVLIDGR
ncbi:MAG: cupin domain-containing protein, partial [Parvularculaceae bacterium]|nr:cupin domain-containing protein [Parvularculaceae bacterium]